MSRPKKQTVKMRIQVYILPETKKALEQIARHKRMDNLLGYPSLGQAIDFLVASFRSRLDKPRKVN